MILEFNKKLRKLPGYPKPGKSPDKSPPESR